MTVGEDQIDPSLARSKDALHAIERCTRVPLPHPSPVAARLTRSFSTDRDFVTTSPFCPRRPPTAGPFPRFGAAGVLAGFDFVGCCRLLGRVWPPGQAALATALRLCASQGFPLRFLCLCGVVAVLPVEGPRDVRIFALLVREV